MKRLIVLISIFVLSAFIYVIAFNHGLVAGKQSVQYSNTQNESLSIDSDKLLSLIQNWRKDQGLSEFVENAQLCRVAEDRVLDGFDDHEGLHLKLKNGDYNFLGEKVLLSENITTGLFPQDALNNWLDSPPHKEALMDDYKYTCVRCEGLYCVQIFSNL